MPSSVETNDAPNSFDNQAAMPAPPLPTQSTPSHRPTNSNSNVTAMTSLKRLSLSFPTQPIDQIRPRPSSYISSSPDKLSYPPSPDGRSNISTEPNAFLTALATQERRVLELREELQKAEADLDKLKKQWAVHEATKKRNELRHVEQLRPLSSPTRPGNRDDDSERRISREEERRKAMHGRAKQPQRKVFEGGRHTRTLSLLSPTSLGQQRSGTGIDSDRHSQQVEERNDIPRRSSTMNESIKCAESSRAQYPKTVSQAKGTKDDLINTGKQLVGDLREGLWTFIEDLRQATVGDEAVNAARPRHKRNASLGRSPARSSSRTRAQTIPNKGGIPQRRKGDLDPSPIARTKLSNALVGVINTKADTSTISANPALRIQGQIELPIAESTVEDDGWDSWDSPAPKLSSPTLSASPRNSLRNTSPSPAASSPRTSMSSTDTTPRVSAEGKTPTSIREQLPWPTLTKLSPGNLTRTASTLMREWEASLSVPADDVQKVKKID